MSEDLTSWDYTKNITVPFIAMVFDQCTDKICDQTGTFSSPTHPPTSFFFPMYHSRAHSYPPTHPPTPLGYLDFDVYSELQPVANGNPRILEWRAVDCPVGDTHKMEYLMCTPGTCNSGDNPNVPAWGEVMNPDFFAVFVRNHRLPIIKVEMQDPTDPASFHNMPFTSGLGWTWSGRTFDVAAKEVKIRVTAADGQVVTETFSHKQFFQTPGAPGYRGGMILQGKQQFGPSHFVPHPKKKKGKKGKKGKKKGGHHHERALLRGSAEKEEGGEE